MQKLPFVTCQARDIRPLAKVSAEQQHGSVSDTPYFTLCVELAKAVQIPFALLWFVSNQTVTFFQEEASVLNP